MARGFLSPIGFSFFAFVAPCFGSFGLTAVRFVFSLADPELRQQDSLLDLQGLPLMLIPSTLGCSLYFSSS